MAHEHMPEQELATLWHEVAQAHFLHKLTTTDTVATLEKRREMVMCLLNQETAQAQVHNDAARLMLHHFSTLLKTELAWLEQSLSMVHPEAHSQD